MAKSRDDLKKQLSKEHPCWNDFDLEQYITGYYAGILEYMRLMEQVKQGEYDAILEYQKQKKERMCN